MNTRDPSIEFRGLPAGVVSRSFFTVLTLLILFCSLGLVSLGMLTVISEDFIEVSNGKNVMYVSSQMGSVKSQSLLLIPEFSVIIGMSYFTIGSNTFSRKQSNVLPLLPFSASSENASGSLLPDDGLRGAYTKVRRDALQFGYATAESCGGLAATTVMLRSRFVLAAAAIGLLCGLGSMIVASHACFNARHQSQISRGVIHVERKRNVVVLLGENVEIKQFIRAQETEKQKERNVIIALVVFGGIAIIFLIIGVAVENNLQLLGLKCGRSFCRAYEDAMGELFDLLPPNEYNCSCKVGYSAVILIVETALAALLFVLTLFLASLHFFMSHAFVRYPHDGATNRRDMSGTSNIVMNPVDVRSQISDVMMPSRRELSGMDYSKREPNHAVSNGYNNNNNINININMSGTRDIGMQTYLFHLFPDLVHREESVETERTENEWEFFNSQPNYNLVLEEGRLRKSIYQEQDNTFRVHFSWVKTKLMEDEVLCKLHQWTLNSFFSPILGLHVQETCLRENIWRSYCNNFLSKIHAWYERAEQYGRIPSSITEAKRTLCKQSEETSRRKLLSHYLADDNIYMYTPPTDLWLDKLTPSSLHEPKTEICFQNPQPINGNLDDEESCLSPSVLLSELSCKDFFDEPLPKIRVERLPDVVNLNNNNNNHNHNNHYHSGNGFLATGH